DGTLGDGYEQLYPHGIGAAFALVSGPMRLEQACRDTARLLHDRARDVARLWQLDAANLSGSSDRRFLQVVQRLTCLW
ncbi:glycerate kinase, partial [Pseudomonas syringae group genomosp. 7]|uniref:glycerate kinase n=1 Tax=Pseudomonas syringae group genomosp. 7 TaxID=251699 RepID=UPI00376F6B69